jgi:predicted MPP superfamily phosphohydrolase
MAPTCVLPSSFMAESYQRWLRLSRLPGAASVLAVVVLGWTTQIEPYRLEVTRHHVSAATGRTITIAHISDLHTSGIGRRERALLREIEAAKPDVVAITGDTVDNGSVETLKSVVAAFRAPRGVFAVLGNWEHWRPMPAVETAFKQAGATLLTNDARELVPGLWIVGLDDVHGFPSPDRAFQNVPPNVTSVTLLHSPAYFDRVASRTTLALAGHTHGGQVRVPGLAPFWLPHGSNGYVEGWYERDRARLYVSRGIGTSILPVRAFCRPELAMITVSP